MNNSTAPSTQHSIRFIVSLCSGLISIAAIASIALLMERTSTEKLEGSISRDLVGTSGELALRLDRRMYERYQNIQVHTRLLSESEITENPSALRSRLDMLQKSYDGYAWIGYARPDGTVMAASAGILEAVNVSGRPWFQRASKSAFVGDVHKALLLEKKLNTDGGEPLRFVDVAMPVLKDGVLNGVLGAHIDWRWLKVAITSTQPTQEFEPILVSASDIVLLGPPDLQDREINLESIRLAKATPGKSGSRLERWPDGKTYLTGYSQTQGYKSYPGLGWTVLQRQDVSKAFAPIAEMRRRAVMWGIVIAGMFAWLGWFIAGRISKPLVAITQAAESLQRGETNTKIPVIQSYRELSVLSQSLASLIEQLLHRDAQLEHQATHHSLTKLPNRSLMKALLGQAISRLDITTTQLAVLTVDLDGFKSVNDTLGYEAGNEVLSQAAQRLESCLGSHSTLGHVGKDEFLLLIEETDPALPRITACVTRVQELLAQPFLVQHTEFRLSASIGAGVFPRDADNAEALLGYSAVALHQAKMKGRGSVEFYNPQMNSSALERLNLEHELREALDLNQFELHYQPQLLLKTGEMIGVEALIRWQHPRRGFVSPAIFIPIAEESGLIVDIGKWVLDTACAQLHAWNCQGLPPLRMSINVSAQQFSDNRLIKNVQDALVRNHLSAESLKVEITETLLMQDVASSIAVMHQLVDLGVKISVDDFGTGYSSLSYLKRFPIHALKVDQSFVRTLSAQSEDAPIVRAIVAMGHSLDLNVIAEGVETAEQLEFLRETGCNEIQGYYFSRPLPADKLAALLREHAEAGIPANS